MPKAATPNRITSFVSTTRSSVRLETAHAPHVHGEEPDDHPDREQPGHRRAGVERVGGVAAEGERVHRHRHHVAEHEEPQQETRELRVALLAQVVERAARSAGAGRDARPGPGGDGRQDAAEHEAREREVPGERDRDARAR